ncbi:hypothetical protein QAD02_006224 [Eretmocerus hayati]|uniref:Uncharacterized protein n=1 Tax=Eretmocerus hayati TaxID=131215 RepID=A0ACC2N0G1_9HYME|nr:hypothetical protein QAD02_006224 [Eretmocerus hayati]
MNVVNDEWVPLTSSTAEASTAMVPNCSLGIALNLNRTNPISGLHPQAYKCILKYEKLETLNLWVDLMEVSLIGHTYNNIANVLTVTLKIFFADVCCTIKTTANPLEGDDVKYVTTGDFNFVAAIALVDPYKPRAFSIFCSGALVSSRHILTNDHCLDDSLFPENIEIYFGSPDLNKAQKYKPSGWALFSKWVLEKKGEPFSLTFDDIAIIRLTEKVESRILKPAVIQWTSYQDLEGKKVEMAGWGTVENDFTSQYMRRAVVKVISQEDCVKQSNLRSIEVGRYFCSNARPCILAGYGDSGSPLLDSKRRIVGITAATCQNHNLANHNPFNLHVNTTFYQDFIHDILVLNSVYNHQRLH